MKLNFLKNTKMKITILLILFIVICFSFWYEKPVLWFFTCLLFIILCIVFLIQFIINKTRKKNEKNSVAKTEYHENIQNNFQLNEITPNLENKITCDAKDDISNEIVKNNFNNDFVFDGLHYVLKYEYDNISIVGSDYIDGATEKINELTVNSHIFISPDENNPHDNHAIKIFQMSYGNEILLGYLKRDSRLYEMANDFFKRDEFVSIKVDENHKGKFKLGFYKIEYPQEYLDIKNSHKKVISFKLSGTRNEEIQSSIEFSMIGEKLELLYDYEKEKNYLESSLGNIGYIPKNKEEFIDELEDFSIYISDIQENDEGIYSVKVELFY